MIISFFRYFFVLNLSFCSPLFAWTDGDTFSDGKIIYRLEKLHSEGNYGDIGVFRNLSDNTTFFGKVISSNGYNRIEMIRANYELMATSHKRGNLTHLTRVDSPIEVKHTGKIPQKTIIIPIEKAESSLETLIKDHNSNPFYLLHVDPEKRAEGVRNLERLSFDMFSAHRQLAFIESELRPNAKMGHILGDIQTGNILVFRENGQTTYKFADYDFMGPTQTSVNANINWSAPSFVRSNRGSFSTELFSIGAVLFEAATSIQFYKALRKTISNRTNKEINYSHTRFAMELGEGSPYFENWESYLDETVRSNLRSANGKVIDPLFEELLMALLEIHDQRRIARTIHFFEKGKKQRNAWKLIHEFSGCGNFPSLVMRWNSGDY